ncbi:hypothetical protein IOC57_12025 [Bacillus sp. SD075]|uniref:hypothetical protein n=1 Tax=Bacillus sp. SD075 TaxID=2781732 RepID=UPI001A95BDC0|nr:hypothetical protein [Bacillus sp. SD075]MBO0998470.1 hypothetical protein [Bacillus sp. SD075]
MKPTVTTMTLPLSDVRRRKNSTSLINVIAEKDFQVAQMLDALKFEYKWGDDV